MKITAFLKTPLFTLDTEKPHAPLGAVVLVGQQIERGDGGITLRVDSFYDAKGRPLKGAPVTLFVPLAKIDNVLHHEV
ncbi:MAG: hypothetical protein H6739_21280 [Alphaproteobacteria bacterium]|nr:hypothetical protein [Alphaproteobacteria bacterium]